MCLKIPKILVKWGHFGKKYVKICFKYVILCWKYVKTQVFCPKFCYVPVLFQTLVVPISFRTKLARDRLLHCKKLRLFWWDSSCFLVWFGEQARSQTINQLERALSCIQRRSHWNLNVITWMLGGKMPLSKHKHLMEIFCEPSICSSTSQEGFLA